MKLYGFLEIFGEYISTDKYRSMLKNTMFTDLHINKEEQSLSALLHIDVFDNILPNFYRNSLLPFSYINSYILSPSYILYYYFFV